MFHDFVHRRGALRAAIGGAGPVAPASSEPETGAWSEPAPADPSLACPRRLCGRRAPAEAIAPPAAPQA